MSAAENAAQLGGHQAWEKRLAIGVMAWTRTDTMRWLDERSAAIVAHYEREHGITFARPPRQMGQWLKLKLPRNFEVMHERLAAAKNRPALTLEEVLP